MKTKVHWTMWLLIGLVAVLVLGSLFTKKDNENRISLAMPKLGAPKSNVSLSKTI